MSVTGRRRKRVVLASTNVVRYVTTGNLTANTWAELIASTSVPILVVGMGMYPSGTGVQTADIGIGTAGNEVVVASGWGAAGTNMAVTAQTMLPYPILVPAGTRMAGRSDTSNTSVFLTYVYESAVL